MYAYLQRSRILQLRGSKTWDCDRSLDGIAGSSVVEVVCCQVDVFATITIPEESYLLWCVFVCDLQTSK
jgi:hypothetical protein